MAAVASVCYTPFMARDFYEVLGVAREASDKDIRDAFRKLARQHHPDVNPGDAAAEERFKEISQAHAVLSDSKTRAAYNRYGERWRDADQIEEMRRQHGPGSPFGGFGGGPGGPGRPGGAGGAQSYEFDLGDLSGGGAGGISGAFESLFRRGGPGAEAARGRSRGRDLEHPVEVTLREAYEGTVRTIELLEEGVVCTVCGGAGTLAGATCHNCRGSGRGGAVRRIEVSIPLGIGSGTRVRVRGKGGPGQRGGGPGDLFLNVTVRADPRFERRGDDLHIELDVPVTAAALGGEVRVPTLKGRTLALTIPAGTRSGRTFRLAGQGMPRGVEGGFGDLHARVRLQLPEVLSSEQLDLLERLRATEGEGNDPDDGVAAGGGDASADRPRDEAADGAADRPPESPPEGAAEEEAPVSS